MSRATYEDANDPLAGLQDIDWAGLSHAYGSAEDVPGQLQELRSPDLETAHQALGQLFGNIFHQGSRYEATAPAVPFLLAVAADPRTAARADTLMLLASIAIGYDEAHLPDGVDIAEWRATVRRLRGITAEEWEREMDEWVRSAPDDGERRSREWHRSLISYDYQLSSASAELAAYDAVRACVPALCDLLDDHDPDVRGMAAYTLAWFPEEAATVRPRLRALLDGEPDASVTATALVSLGLLDDRDMIPTLRRHLTAPEQLVRCGAAIALARLGTADADVVRELALASLAPPGENEPSLPFLQADLPGYTALTLAALDGGVPAEAVDTVLDGLSRAPSGPPSFALATAALRLTFGDPTADPPPPYDALTGPQQRAVRVLAELPAETWQWVNFMEILGAWRLPTDHDSCRAYAGLTAPSAP